MSTPNPNGPIIELRVALTTRDYERLTKFYSAGLGLEPAQLWNNGQGRALVLNLGSATLEIFDETQAQTIDQIEAGQRLSGPVRFALQVPDLNASMERLIAHGATLVHPPIKTPWGDYNVRLQDPDGMQITLFQKQDVKNGGFMDMKGHILAALKEEFDRWEELLASLSEEQINSPLLPSTWSVKDGMAHLRAWQQRSIARVEAARLNRYPEFPNWLANVDPDAKGSTKPINAWIYEANREKSWSEVHQNWREGFQRFLEAADRIAERDLLDSSRYLWLDGYSMAYILLASYDHHQEHLDKLLTWLRKHKKEFRT